ncbi:hypothetical protein [Shimia aestuarii]|uniref:Uncharacterized protein n=1 Tax=Shimia aestuarii TaxID=254406 RepID=A0A1I4NMM5_9RHOB|nr:hypothetical protein [Shimia aestuarii]SFM16739.1 hypothetical protein SAMN04488042_104272 [Shimia aestuarii]
MTKQTYIAADIGLKSVKGSNASISKTINAIASQLGDLTAADVSQLRDLAVLMVKIEDNAGMIELAKKAQDLAMWHKMVSLGDKLVATKRMLLKDLKITRSSIPAPQTGAREAKAQGKGGSEWKGVL